MADCRNLHDMEGTQATSAPAATGTASHRWEDRLIAGAFILLWCSGYPAGKIAVQHGGPFTLLAWRFALAAAIFGLLALAGRAARPARACVVHSVVVGVLSLAISFGGVYTGLKLGVSSGIAALIVGAMPLSTALCATVVGERLTWRQWVGLAVLGERLTLPMLPGFALVVAGIWLGTRNGR
jgi:drug/metabolite transporter (DMT)-like permease